MATTTAAVTLTSDLLSDAMSVNASTTCMKAGTTADGLDQLEYAVVEIATGDEYDLICATPTASKASKLYGGDWMFIPADFHDAAGDIAITSNGGTNKIEYALFHEGTALTTT